MLRNSKTLVLVLALALGLCGLGLAHAQERPLDIRQVGYEHGYHDGFDHGRQDRSYREGYNLRSQDFRDGDHGYERYMGDRDRFRDGYRDGYRAGYDDGYYAREGRFNQPYGQYGGDVYDRRGDGDRDDGYFRRGDRYSDIAFETGYRDGLEAARNDWRKHKGSRPENHENYEDAGHGYHASYGPKNLYKQRYRQGFVRGYEDAGTGRY